MVDKSVLSRREFLRILSVAVAAYPLSSLAENRQQAKQSTKNKKYKLKEHKFKDPWLTIASVQEHLFPAEDDSPGANDIQALAYLRGMMETPDFEKEDAILIHNGVGWLNDLAISEYKKKFIQLDADLKEKILRRVESSRAGSRWISMLLAYLLEALLTDPVYGGNPNGIGWTWLQHQPGFPTPPEDKKYYQLRKATYRNIKA